MNFTRISTNFIVVLSVALLFFSCKKSDHNGIYPGEIVDLGSKVNSSVSGFVTDENNIPVSGATVRFGSRIKATDRYGFFEFSNIEVPKNAAMVSVERRGYFPGIRTFIAKQGKPAFVRIKLLPKTNVNNLDAAGGIATLPNGLSVKLPANAVVDASTGEAYNGLYTVAMQWIDPTAADLAEIMPGDLRAIDANNRMKLLITYGMASVELKAITGSKLQLAPGKKAELTFPLPASLSATAPASIPLWHFDETTGLWKEEGSAVKAGNFYTGEVGHFSFWNLDMPNTFVEFDVTIKDQSGQPIPFAFVKLSKLNDPTVRSGGITNSAGFVNGAVFINEQFKMEVFVGSSCTAPLHTLTFSTTTSNISLGDVTISNNPQFAQVQGTVTDCNNNPLANAFVYATIADNSYRYATNASGAYNFTTTLCGSTSSITLIADHTSAQQQSPVTTHSIIPGNNTIPNLKACGVNMEEYIFYTIDNDQYYITAPPDSIAFSSTSETWLSGYQGGSSKIQLQYSSIGYGQNGTTLWMWSIHQAGIWSTTNITQFDPPGGFIKGHGTFTFNDSQNPAIVHTVIVSFKKRRPL